MQIKIHPVYRVLVITQFLVLLLFSTHSAVALSENKPTKSVNPEHFLAFEIEGVSLNTPLKSIPGILQGHGYTQTSRTMYNKQRPIPGGRKSIFRVEVNDTGTSRHISYFRVKSGGRVKSPPKQEELILAEEADMASKLYKIVCADHITQEQNEQYCPPMSASNIQLNQGEFLQIEGNFGIKLSATEAMTTIEVKYANKN